MRTPDLTSQRGIALAMAIFALVVIGGIVSATFYMGYLEQQSGRNTMYATQAFEASEAGLTATLENWNSAIYNAMAPGDTLTLPTVNMTGRVSFTAALTRLNPNIFLVRSTGSRSDAGGNVLAERTVATLSRLLVPSIDITAALTVNGTIGLGGSAEVSGVDSIPAGWSSCPSPSATGPGIRSSGNTVTTTGANCASLNCVTGNPQFLGGDTTVTSSTFTDFNGITFADLAAMATWTISGTLTSLSPSLNGAACNEADNRNWGEPYTATGFGACFDYFPILYAPGDVHMSGGRGQGILLVGGDLRLSGGVEFFGPVIVQGRVRSTGTGGHIYGGLMANGVSLNPTSLTGNSVAQFSTCAIARALNGTSVVQPVTGRAWTQIYSTN
ncbi:MAG: pilus assembly PilX N-terminal domain-containing protein [Gemmatimonadetes bacterium]|nr:pilus assembly PilX N-terminal domain-containing protein [Gemmatimonadota bacterium]